MFDSIGLQQKHDLFHILGLSHLLFTACLAALLFICQVLLFCSLVPGPFKLGPGLWNDADHGGASFAKGAAPGKHFRLSLTTSGLWLLHVNVNLPETTLDCTWNVGNMAKDTGPAGLYATQTPYLAGHVHAYFAHLCPIVSLSCWKLIGPWTCFGA